MAKDWVDDDALDREDVLDRFRALPEVGVRGPIPGNGTISFFAAATRGTGTGSLPAPYTPRLENLLTSEPVPTRA